jgi:hypothetical protein
MGRSTVRPWDRLLCRNRIPKWSTSAWARRNCAATSCRAMASTNPSMAARRGSTLGWRRLRLARGFAFIQRTRTLSLSRRWVILMGRTRSAACFVPPTVARRGSASSTATRSPARSIFAWTRRTPAFCSPRFGRLTAHRGHFRAAAPAAASSNRPTVATRGLRSRAILGCRAALSERSLFQFPEATAIESTRSWRRWTAACFGPTTQVQHGRARASIPTSASGLFISGAFRPIQKIAIPFTR